MRVFLNPPAGLSMAMSRVAVALAATAAEMGFEVVSTPSLADLHVLHVIGYPETVEEVRRLKALGRKYAIIQYCIRTTQETHTQAWLHLWADAEFVWSYYDLEALIKEDERWLAWQEELNGRTSPFVMTPLGVDRTFRPWPSPKKALVFTSGYVGASETVYETWEAAVRVSGKAIHLGPSSEFQDAPANVGFIHGINDGILSQAYSRCWYVTGLRRGEGFELPAAEGLLCGARPICFDRPHYRQWFGDMAVYVPEGPADEVTNALEQVFRSDYRPVTDEELTKARALFDWTTITKKVWSHLVEKHGMSASKAAAAKVEAKRTKYRRRLLWVGDAVVASGFAKATHGTLSQLTEDWEIEVLGLNYFGEPHDYPYIVRPALNRRFPQDGFGIKTTALHASTFGPDVIVVQNDPWNLHGYMKAAGNFPMIASLAVDGHNMATARDLNGLRSANFWTKFGELQARNGGYAGKSSVIPLGVDLDVFKEHTESDKTLLRRVGLPQRAWNGFIVGNANRNQPRKRLDLTIRYFCEWVKRHNVADAFLYLHVAPTGDQGYNCQQLMEFYGLGPRLILQEPEIGFGAPESGVANTFNMWDLQISTTQGEGWGLTTMEGMACGVPQIVPDWSALKEWAAGAAMFVPCTSVAVTPNNINVVGGVPDEEFFIELLHKAYTNREMLRTARLAGLELVRRPEYRWEHISRTFGQMINEVL